MYVIYMIMITRSSKIIFNSSCYTGLSYLHCHRIKVLSPHTISAFGISYLNMLARASDWLFNPIRYTGQIDFWRDFANTNIGSVPTNGLLRSGHLDIKDEQCAKKMMGVKFYITSYRVWAPRASKRGVWAPKNSTFFRSG